MQRGLLHRVYTLRERVSLTAGIDALPDRHLRRGYG
jgi:hypothetical protein